MTNSDLPSGYRTLHYADSLSEQGTPVELPRSQGYIIKRPIPGTPYSDAMGTYPMFFCDDWSRLPEDLNELQAENSLVSLALVTDPFGQFQAEWLQQAFADVCTPFKAHFVVDLQHDPLAGISSNHRRKAKRALNAITVDIHQHPAHLLDDWVALYGNLISRHDIRGMLAFSRAAFKKQLQVPGAIAFQACHEGATVGMLLWYQVGNSAYYHLGAFSDAGYTLGASFALFRTAIEHFATTRLDWLDLGAGAGVDGSGTDGLTRFKRGWSRHSRPVYFCGRILSADHYQALSDNHPDQSTSYFPRYRSGEFS